MSSVHKWAPHQKPSLWGSVLANEMWGVINSDLGDVVEEGYLVVKGLGGGEQTAHEGVGNLAKNQN